MIDQNFINSNFNKFGKLFFQKKMSSIITLSDGEKDVINNVIYVEVDDEHIGMYLNGTNPYFTKSFIGDIDIFNLYEHYSVIGFLTEKIEEFSIDSIKIVFNSDYNELLGFYFSDSSNDQSFSIIFITDELKIFKNIKFDEYVQEINENLLHINRKKIYSINSNNKIWDIE